MAGKRNTPIMQQNIECWASKQCEDSEEEMDIHCPRRPWSDWSPCSASCGKGFKERYRFSLDPTENRPIYWPYQRSSKDEEDFDEEDPCNNLKVRETVECFEKPCQEKNKPKTDMACTLPKDMGACKSNIDRWYFDIDKGRCEIFSYSGCEGNDNNFNTLEQCQTLCKKYHKDQVVNDSKKTKDSDYVNAIQYNIQNDAFNYNNTVIKSNSKINGEDHAGNSFFGSLDIDCDLTNWGDWSKCNITGGTCGYGIKEKRRSILVQPLNNGRPCPTKLVKRKKCRVSCKDEYHSKIGPCVMTAWSPWSKCGQTCENEYQHRFRHVLIQPKVQGIVCQNEVEQRPCPCV